MSAASSVKPEQQQIPAQVPKTKKRPPVTPAADFPDSDPEDDYDKGYVMSQNKLLERFSFERRKVIGFAITMPHDWLKKLAPHFHPIRSKTKTNRDSLARIFPRFASVTCNYYEF